MIDEVVFAIAAVIVLGGGIGVVAMRNPVHCALSLVASFFGIAVLFVDLDAHFLAAVQVIVYAGAIVVLFLFVIMLLGVDKAEDLDVQPLVGQKAAGIVTGVALLVAALATFVLTDRDVGEVVTGTPASQPERMLIGAEPRPNVEVLGEAIFTDHLFAFEITSVLLIIAVVGAVVLARTPRASKEADG